MCTHCKTQVLHPKLYRYQETFAIPVLFRYIFPVRSQNSLGSSDYTIAIFLIQTETREIAKVSDQNPKGKRNGQTDGLKSRGNYVRIGNISNANDLEE